MREFGFEVSLCASLEQTEPGIIARQLGSGVINPGSRILDIVHLTPGAQFQARTELTPAAVPQWVLDADLGPGRFRPAATVLDMPSDRRSQLLDQAVESGIIERRRHDGREELKLVDRYPTDWFDTIVGIENKPDLGRPGALDRQLRVDVELAVVDRIILATASHVTGAHLDRLPDPVGVWRYQPGETIEVIREPTPLDTEAPGIEITAQHPGQTELAVASTEAKHTTRRRLAERAYGKGWRTYELPACENLAPTTVHGTDGLPYCQWADRIVDPAHECGPTCPGYAQADPPDVDFEAERARRTAWTPDSTRHQRKQAGLDRFR